MKNPSTSSRIKVLVFGTFDGLHEGHLNFFKQARGLAQQAFLIVSVARDENVFKIKGAYPVRQEKERIKLLEKTKLVKVY